MIKRCSFYYGTPRFILAEMNTAEQQSSKRQPKHNNKDRQNCPKWEELSSSSMDPSLELESEPQGSWCKTEPPSNDQGLGGKSTPLQDRDSMQLTTKAAPKFETEQCTSSQKHPWSVNPNLPTEEKDMVKSKQPTKIINVALVDSFLSFQIMDTAYIKWTKKDQCFEFRCPFLCSMREFLSNGLNPNKSPSVLNDGTKIILRLVELKILETQGIFFHFTPIIPYANLFDQFHMDGNHSLNIGFRNEALLDRVTIPKGSLLGFL